MIGSARSARPHEKVVRHPRWQGPASSAQVSRSRACRPEVGVPLPAASTAGLEAPTGRPGGVPSSAAS